jgi:hypothetical protein
MTLLKKEYDAKEVQGPITLNTNWRYHNSFLFHKLAQGADWLELTAYHKETDTASTTDFYYVVGEEWPLLEGRYERWKDFGWQGDRPLLKRRDVEPQIVQ